MDVQLLILLWAGHYVADFALQTSFMSDTKKLIFVKDIGFHALTAHAFIHGLVAIMISQNFTAGLVVGSTHWLIDFTRSSVFLNELLRSKKIIKSKKDALYGIHTDQFLHFLVIFAVAWRLS